MVDFLNGDTSALPLVFTWKHTQICHDPLKIVCFVTVVSTNI